jgi:hypothetical protein
MMGKLGKHPSKKTRAKIKESIRKNHAVRKSRSDRGLKNAWAGALLYSGEC